MTKSPLQRLAAAAILAGLVAGVTPRIATAQAPHLFYEADGDGPPVVLVPDWAHDTGSWFLLLPGLRDDFRLVRYDLRGQGRSEPAADRDYSLAAHRGDLERLIAGLRIERVRLVGIGLGATVAEAFASEHPDDVAGVVLVNPVLAWSEAGRSSWFQLLDAWIKVGRPTLGEYASVLVQRWFGTQTVDVNRWLPAYYDLMLRRQPAGPLVDSLGAWLSADEHPERKPPADVPVLLVRSSMVTEPGGESRIRAAFPRVQVRRLEGARWEPQISRPQELARLIAEFFGT